MTAPALRLSAARWLLEAGAGQSARSLLGDVRGREANDLRELAAGATLRPGIYALVVHERVGIVVPMKTRLGRPSQGEPDLLSATATAQRVASAWLGVASLPWLSVELDELFGVNGTSLTLPLALAYVAHFSRSATPLGAVLCSGRLDDSGAILGVTQLPEKLAAAVGERGERRSLLPPGASAAPGLRCYTPESFSHAVQLAFVSTPRADHDLIAIDAQLARSRLETDNTRAVEQLRSLAARALSTADRARVQLELGTRLRHAGQSLEAEQHHESARELFAQERLTIGAETVERFELEVMLTAMDQFKLEPVVRRLRQRLHEPFLSLRNELRARGMLAQALAMTGAYAEAISVRSANLPLHERSDDLARVLPGTLCCLTLDSARAGDTASFELHATRLLVSCSSHDDVQLAYDSYAVLRALSVLGRWSEALAWAEGRARLFGVAAPALLQQLASGHHALNSYPQVSIGRAFARVLRKQGQHKRVLDVAASTRVDESGATDLVAWLAQLTQLEATFSRRALGQDADGPLADARAALRRLHPAAAAHHARLLECPTDLLERELDAVYY